MCIFLWHEPRVLRFDNVLYYIIYYNKKKSNKIAECKLHNLFVFLFQRTDVPLYKITVALKNAMSGTQGLRFEFGFCFGFLTWLTHNNRMSAPSHHLHTLTPTHAHTHRQKLTAKGF